MQDWERRFKAQADTLESIIRTGRDIYRGQRRWINTARHILRTLHEARGGGPAARVAAGVAIGAVVLEEVYPERTLEEELEKLGFHDVNSTIGEFLCNVLERKTPTRIVREMTEEPDEARIWTRAEGSFAGIYNKRGSSERTEGPFVCGGDDLALKSALTEIAWSAGKDLILCKGDKGRVELAEMGQVGSYFGEPSPESIARRIGMMGSEPRAHLIVGPSGVGKSVLARRVAEILGGRVLRVSGKMLPNFGPAEIRDLVTYLRPSILLLDDATLHESERGRDNYSLAGGMLDLLEVVRVSGCSTIITRMEQVDPDESLRCGQFYLEGLRPGRIDAVTVMTAPDDDGRDTILRGYYAELGLDVPSDIHRSIVKKTRGLTGAYLRELVLRFTRYGLDDYVEEIVSVLVMAPHGSGEGEKKPRSIAYGSHYARRVALRRARGSAVERRKRRIKILRKRARSEERLAGAYSTRADKLEAGLPALIERENERKEKERARKERARKEKTGKAKSKKAKSTKKRERRNGGDE